MQAATRPVDSPAPQRRLSPLRVIYYRDLLVNLIGREIRGRYRRSALGILWSLINPLLSMLIFVFLFHTVLKFNVPHYPVYVFSGLLAWNWFSISLSTSTYTLYSNRDLIRKPGFPTEVLTLVNVGSNLVNYLLSLPVLLGLMFVDGVSVTTALAVLPFVLLIQFLFTAGICYFLAILNVYYRDVEHFVVIATGMWFYITPIFYQTNAIDQKYAILYEINPMAQLMRAYRAVFLTGQFPGLHAIGGVSAVAVGFFAAGLVFFNRLKADVVDEL